MFVWEVLVLVKLRARFEKKDRAKYISHLDLYRFMQRTFKRAGISVWYTEGFNPHLYIMFPLPLSLGFESDCEIMDFNITDDNLSPQYIVEKMNSVLPDGIKLTDLYEPVMKHTEIAYSVYDILLISDNKEFCKEKFDSFISQDEIIIKKKTKKKTFKDVDIKPVSDVLAVSDTPQGLSIKLKMPSGSAVNYNPSLLLDAFYAYTGAEPEFARINRTNIITKNGDDFR